MNAEDVIRQFIVDHVLEPLREKQDQKLERIKEEIDTSISENDDISDILKKVEEMVIELRSLTSISESILNQANSISENSSNNHDSLVKRLDDEQKNIAKLTEKIESNHTSIESSLNTYRTSQEDLFKKLEDVVKINAGLIENGSESLKNELQTVVESLITKTAQKFSSISSDLAEYKTDQLTKLENQSAIVASNHTELSELFKTNGTQILGFQKRHTQLIVGMLVSQAIQIAMIIYLLVV